MNKCRRDNVHKYFTRAIDNRRTRDRLKINGTIATYFTRFVPLFISSDKLMIAFN